MRNVTRLKTQKDRLQEDQADLLKQALLPFAEGDGAMRDAVGRLYVQINRLTTPEPGTTEPFVMIRPAQNAAVVDWLEANSKRPMKAMRVWALLFDHLMPHTGQIMLTREEIAEKVGIEADDVSKIMRELASFGAIFTSREKVAGLRGPGFVRYFMNKHVAEVGSRATQAELDLIPKPGAKLEVVQGGKS
jgi:CRP-like cAMP-binding protein